ncbi:MAG: endonuclease/exonuclease/phosphatase family protein [Deltaproteobacteria bacterium]|nr:endonuclease/exonuclease/phosphatase family protein [Deltaproteobacteria bacterium]MBW2121320.1 endonuclease/exonuclease/phosphatase family protein [Deltaproteobacteria bacterium]
MRFLLYNIRYGAGIGKQFHLPVPYSGYLKHTQDNLKKILVFIKSLNPDIIGLLEVDSGSFRSDRCNQAEAIARAMKYHHVYQSKYSAASMAQKVPVLNKQGNAILTKQEIRSQRFHYFREGIKRLVIEVELDRVSIFLVHLSVKFRHRQYQLQDLHGMVENVRKPVIVAGDFNVFWGDRELQLFLAATGLKNANGRGQPSHPSRSPRRQLDYIFHSPEVRVTGFQIPRVRLSDHAPLVCDFEIVP